MLELIDQTVNAVMAVFPVFKMLVANVEDFFKAPIVSQALPEGALDEVTEDRATSWSSKQLSLTSLLHLTLIPPPLSGPCILKSAGSSGSSMALPCLYLWASLAFSQCSSGVKSQASPITPNPRDLF